jgi:hypothetical protein
MPPPMAGELRFPCGSGWCGIRGLILIALWIALVAGFLAATTMASQAPPGAGNRNVEESPARLACGP